MDERALQAIKEADLMAYRDVIEKLLEPAIHIETTRVEDPSTLEIGASRIGGIPDLPRGYDWPRFNGKAQHFLAQINLNELNEFSCANVLPQRGMLYFFYDCDQKTWGYDPKDRESFTVQYFDPVISELQLTEYPDEVEKPGFFKRLISNDGKFGKGFHPCSVKFRLVHTLPEEIPDELLKVEEPYIDFQCETLPNHYGVAEHEHQQLLGHPTPVQGDMRLDCELVSNGFNCGNSKPFEQADIGRYENKAKDWVLLFQLVSDDDAGMMWGDLGTLYFMIRKQDLANCRFNRAWMIFQCH